MSCRELSLTGLCVVLLFLYLFTFMDGLPQQYPELNDCDDIMSIYIMLMFFLVDDFPSFTSSADPEWENFFFYYFKQEEKENVKATYTQNPLSMLQYEYRCVFFVVRKPLEASLSWHFCLHCFFVIVHVITCGFDHK